MVERGEEETGEDGGSVARVSRARDPAPPRVRSPRLRVVHPRAPVVAAARRDGEGTRHQTGDSSLLTDLLTCRVWGAGTTDRTKGEPPISWTSATSRSHPSAGHGPTEDPRRRPSRPTGKSATRHGHGHDHNHHPRPRPRRVLARPRRPRRARRPSPARRVAHQTKTRRARRHRRLGPRSRHIPNPVIQGYYPHADSVSAGLHDAPARRHRRRARHARRGGPPRRVPSKREVPHARVGSQKVTRELPSRRPFTSGDDRRRYGNHRPLLRQSIGSELHRAPRRVLGGSRLRAQGALRGSLPQRAGVRGVGRRGRHDERRRR